MNIVMDWKNWRKNWSISYLISCTWLKLGSSAKKNIWKQIFQNIRCKWYMLTKVCLLLEHNWTILMNTWRLRNCVLKSVGKSLNLPNFIWMKNISFFLVQIQYELARQTYYLPTLNHFHPFSDYICCIFLISCCIKHRVRLDYLCIRS